MEEYIKEGLKEESEIFQYDLLEFIVIFYRHEQVVSDFYRVLFFRKYKFSLQEVEGFRYRARDAWRAVTRIAVREARLKEIKQEILNSKKLKVIINVIFF